MAKKEKAPDLADAVLDYLNLRDGVDGSQQDYDDAVAAMVAALPDSHTPRSLAFNQAPASAVVNVSVEDLENDEKNAQTVADAQTTDNQPSRPRNSASRK